MNGSRKTSESSAIACVTRRFDLFPANSYLVSPWGLASLHFGSLRRVTFPPSRNGLNRVRCDGVRATGPLGIHAAGAVLPLVGGEAPTSRRAIGRIGKRDLGACIGCDGVVRAFGPGPGVYFDLRVQLPDEIACRLRNAGAIAWRQAKARTTRRTRSVSSCDSYCGGLRIASHTREPRVATKRAMSRGGLLNGSRADCTQFAKKMSNVCWMNTGAWRRTSHLTRGGEFPLIRASNERVDPVALL